MNEETVKRQVSELVRMYAQPGPDEPARPPRPLRLSLLLEYESRNGEMKMHGVTMVLARSDLSRSHAEIIEAFLEPMVAALEAVIISAGEPL